MKERPILFIAAMVRALLDGTKTQTRRVVKTKHGPDEYERHTSYGDLRIEGFGDPGADDHEVIRCPYGVVGDRLWVKETHALLGGTMRQTVDDLDDADGVIYRADNSAAFYTGVAGVTGASVLRPGLFGDHVERWRPSIFMPRWASRITLEITDVLVQRLHDISEEDAGAEGVKPETWGADAAAGLGAVLAYSRLWDEINGAGEWDANPWVWAITFKRVTP